MFGSQVVLKGLWLLAGSLVASGLSPAPLIYDASSGEEDFIQIGCVAPAAYVDAWFDLLKVHPVHTVQKRPAAEGQHSVTFLLERVPTSNGQYRCQYGIYNGTELQKSELSNILMVVAAESDFTSSPPTEPPGSDSKGPAWVLPTVLSVAGVLLLGAILAVVVIAVGRFKDRRKKKRELQSCWTQTSYPQTETSFSNASFTVSVKSHQEADDGISTARRARPTSRHSLGKPDFFTFKTST